MRMNEKLLKRYLFASDFDQTLSFNDSGFVLSELLGVPKEEFERRSKGMAKLNLVQQGAELAYLLLHDPEFHDRVRREHLFESAVRDAVGQIAYVQLLAHVGLQGNVPARRFPLRGLRRARKASDKG